MKMKPLFLEEATELIHHAIALRVRGTVTGRALLLAMVLVLLDSILGDATNDGSTNSSENSVVRLVAHEATSSTTCQSAGETTLTLLGLAGSTLLVVVAGGC